MVRSRFLSELFIL